ncbi:hypothetical protein [Ureibacillus sp. FSL W7-1570]|uniref:hypothetical protein n=1 Tax=Ureibacillus sp. FSL W7-1570 TaxID=2954593 RepID=UPI0031599E72
MSWLLQWVLPNEVNQIDDLYRVDIEESIHQLEAFALAHQNEIKKVYIWVRLHRPFSIRQQMEFEERWEKELRKKIHQNVELIVLDRKKGKWFENELIEVNREIHRICIEEPFEEMVLISRGEHSQLQQAVLIGGIKTFANRFCLMLQDQATGELIRQQFHDSPYKKSWLQLFQHLIHDYNYVGALKLMEGLEKNDRTRFIKYLLEVQLLRQNFNFEKALEKFMEAKKIHPASNLRLLEMELILQCLNGEQGEQKKELEQIQELYRHIKALLLKGDYPAFLVRFYRAREAVLRYIVKYGPDEKIDIPRASSIYQFINQVEELYEEGKINRYFGVYFYIKSSNVANALNVRNKSFIGHNRKSISKNAIFHEYYGSKNIKIPQATERFLGDTRIMLRDLGGALDDNLEAMNLYLIELMFSAAREGAVKVD